MRGRCSYSGGMVTMLSNWENVTRVDGKRANTHLDIHLTSSSKRYRRCRWHRECTVERRLRVEKVIKVKCKLERSTHHRHLFREVIARRRRTKRSTRDPRVLRYLLMCILKSFRCCLQLHKHCSQDSRLERDRRESEAAKKWRTPSPSRRVPIPPT